MNLIDISIRRPVFAWILMSFLIIFGAICALRLGISQMPNVDFPILDISVSYEGASPEVVESDLIEPIEERLLSIEGIKEMRSTVRQNGGSVKLEFDIERNVDIALQEVQAALSQLRLPTGIDPPVIRKTNPDDDPIMFVGVSAKGKPFREVLIWTDTFFLDQLRFLPNVGEVSIAGFSQRNLRIWIDPEKLKSKDLTISDVVQTVASQHFESATGQYTQKDKEYRMRWQGEATSIEQMANLDIIRRAGRPIEDVKFKIKDVARVEDGLTDIRRVARINGSEALTIAVRKQKGANEVEVAKAVTKKIEELKANLPEGYIAETTINFTKPTEAAVNSTLEKLLIAALVTIVVCFLFLGTFQGALNILLSIPTSIVGTFIIVYFSGFTLNLFTLLALTLAISIVVDDAIMLLENIVRHYRMGKSPVQASSEASKEILPAAIAATLAVVAVFLPVVFMEGAIGKFFFQFGVTLSAAVMLSLVEAVTITPMRAAAFLSTAPKISRFELFLDHHFEGWAKRYQNILKKTLKYPLSVTLVSIFFFVLSLLLFRNIKQEFVPAQDQNLILISAQTPPGSSLEFTNEASYKVEEIVKKIPERQRHFITIGAGGPSAETNQMFMALELSPKNERKRKHTDIMADLRNQFKELKGVRVSMRDTSVRGLASGRTFPLSFNVRGPDLEVLREKTAELMKRLNDEGLTVDLDSDFKTGLPEIILEPNREMMAARGIDVESVGLTLATAVGGLRLGRYTAEGKRYDIRFKIPQDKIQSLEDVSKIYVRNYAGYLVPLSQLVKIREEKTYQSITRVNRLRAISVFGNIAPGKSQNVVLEKARTYAKEMFPPGYVFALEGASASFNESFQSLFLALIVGIIAAYGILAIQFNSFVHPVSVLMALPFSVTGAVLTLWMTGNSLNLFSYIGLIVLMGIAKKNSILLVEFTNHLRAQGELNVRTALENACPVRLRPILMTSVATVAAAIPLAFGNMMGSETRLPMGLAIIGGTILSTVLTLFVVPCFYLLTSRLERTKPISAL